MNMIRNYEINKEEDIPKQILLLMMDKMKNLNQKKIKKKLSQKYHKQFII